MASRPGLLLMACAASAVGAAAAADPSYFLPIHIEESHAGSFYHFVETLPTDQPHTLVLFDAHSDTNAIPRSDEIREGIRKGPTREHRDARMDEWRAAGRIQAFNWIEPLMPLPIDEVVWIPRRRLAEERRAEMEARAREYLDAYLDKSPRESGRLGSRYRVTDFETFAVESRSWPESRAVVASIDLDYFLNEPAEDLEEIMEALCGIRSLRSLSFAISSPYQRDAESAERLLVQALDVAWRVPNAEVRFDPHARTGPDRSLMAYLMERRGERLPAFDIAAAGPELRSILRHRNHPASEDWGPEPFEYAIVASGALKSAEDVWELEFRPDATLEIEPKPIGSRVRWWAQRAAEGSYRIRDRNLGFARSSPKWIWMRRHLLAEGPVLDRIDLATVADGADRGTFEIYAEIVRDGEAIRTPTEIVMLSKPGSSDYRAAWSRQFGMPYVFDSTILKRGRHTGPEARFGADCANFITAGLRAEGWRLPWGSPDDLRPFLAPAETMLAEPLLLDFGKHIAALWEDRPPLGVLDDDDLCVHQLEGPPEIIRFGELRKNRPDPKLLTVREPDGAIRIAICGDLMLGRGMARHEDPLALVAPILKGADLALGNLECVFGTEPADHPLKLVAPPEAAALLREAGFHGLGHENNHAMDLGEAGRDDTRRALEAEGIAVIGESPRRFRIRGREIAVVALDDSREDASVPRIEPGADYVIALPHWGAEHVRVPTPRQRELAAALLHGGVDLIAGSGPHVLQRVDFHPLGLVAYSLGNTLFDGPGPDPYWDQGGVLEVVLDPETMRPVRVRLIPVAREPGLE